MGVMLGLYGCTDELEGVGNHTRPSDVICFTASLKDSRTTSVSRSASGCLEMEEEEWLVGVETEQGASRGTPVTLLDGTAGVIGYAYDTWGTGITPWSSLYNVQFNFDGDELTAAEDNDVRWNTMVKTANGYIDNVRFYLYAPHNLTGGKLSDQYTGGTPTLNYTVNENVKLQDDLIVASWQGSKGTNYGIDTKTGKVIQPQSIPLSFEHVLTGVKFKVGFPCKVISLLVQEVYNSGTYTFGGNWSVKNTGENIKSDYTFNFGNKVGDTYTGQEFSSNAVLTDGENTLLMIPQEFPTDATAEIVLQYKKNKGEPQTKRYPLAGKVWQPGKMVTYTLHETQAVTPIYFDLAAGNVVIGSTYSGKIYVAGEERNVAGSHETGNKYYVYQSSTSEETYNAANTGYPTIDDFTNKTNCRIPDYEEVTYGTQKWRDFITNNNHVESVIEAWYAGMGSTPESDRADLKGRIGTPYSITVNAVENTNFDLIIDDIYSTYQSASTSRVTGGITFSPATISNCVLTITTLGDNRFGNIFYYNKPNEFISSATINNYSKDEYITKNISNGSKIVFEGTGSLTVADVIEKKDAGPGWTGVGYFANHYCAAIGGNDDGTHEQSSGIEINSGILFAGTTAAENCSAIGGGGNGFGEVIINGGTITAVASTTGTAIGGGIGYSSHGGEGRVHIHGGNVYAYNLDNKRRIPSSAIGGAGSSSSVGTWGTVNITGGYVYAYSALGTAIGGGSSEAKTGGNAVITITGGQVIAKSGAGAGIGGGSACTGGNGTRLNGGTATINISGNPIIRTGSIGGGSTKASSSSIGSANITISGEGDIQAQFVMAAGAKETPSFTMSGGTIRNSNTDDDEYRHLQEQGGAVYLEDGTFTMTGGVIKNCSAEQGGAVYIAQSSTGSATFKMIGGQIHSCFATGKKDEDGAVLKHGHGGAVCLNGGKVQMSGGRIWNNYSENGNGGAIYINNGNFSMDDTADKGLPRIDGNSAQKGDGGGVFVSSAGSAVQVDLLQGIITNNTANNYGGGVCVDMGNTQNAATVTAGVAGEGATEDDAKLKIYGNASMMAGGGLYVRGINANITINSGMIDKNKVSAYVKNENVANEGGQVLLNAGQVTHVVVTFRGNGGTFNDSDTYTQKIVTNTNSKLQANSFNRNGYDFAGWNTRADGKGTSYSNYHLMNISEPITLYAKWKAK